MFQGFSDKTVDFMWNLRFNNRRDWFLEHREECREVFTGPMQALSEEIFAYLKDKLPGYDLYCRMCRVYRDARYVHGGGPYRDNLWFSVQQQTEDYPGTVCFWFEIAPEGWNYGLGYYILRPLAAAKLRARMDRDPKPMAALAGALSGQSEFVLEGPSYARPRQAAEPLLQPWYDKRNIALLHREELTEELFSRAVVGRIEKGYDSLLPLYRYLCTLDADPDPRDPK